MKIYAYGQALEKSYSDWHNFRDFIQGFHTYQGPFEFVDLGPKGEGFSDCVSSKIESG